MTYPLKWVAHPTEILGSLREFNRDVPRFDNEELARDLLRRTQYWVHDVPSGTFGPAKFVGFQDMTYDRYKWAREKSGLRKSVGDRFDGYWTRLAIARAMDTQFNKNPDLHDALVTWGEALVGQRVFENLDQKKWEFVDLRIDEAEVLDEGDAWSEWASLTQEEVKIVPKKPGSYLVRAADEKGRPRTIRRCVGDDRDGILNVGHAEDLRSRIDTLLRRMTDLGIGDVFPLAQLQFRCHVTKNSAAATELESALLQAYETKHFEMPPLTFKLDFRHDA